MIRSKSTNLRLKMTSLDEIISNKQKITDLFDTDKNNNSQVLRALRIARKRKQLVELLRSGKSYDEISKLTGLKKSMIGVYKQKLLPNREPVKPNISPDKRVEMTRKRIETMSNKTPEEIAEIRQKISDTTHRRYSSEELRRRAKRASDSFVTKLSTDEAFRQEFSRKSSLARNIFWIGLTDVEREIICLNMSLGKQSKSTPEERSTIARERWLSLSEQKRNELLEKAHQGVRSRWQNMSENDRELVRQSLRLESLRYWQNLDPEMRKKIGQDELKHQRILAIVNIEQRLALGDKISETH
jgi:hypothetical protein